MTTQQSQLEWLTQQLQQQQEQSPEQQSWEEVNVPVEWEVGLPVPIKHQWHAISHDVSSQDLEKMVLKTTKNV